MPRPLRIEYESVLSRYESWKEEDKRSFTDKNAIMLFLLALKEAHRLIDIAKKFGLKRFAGIPSLVSKLKKELQSDKKLMGIENKSILYLTS